jgi:hypothetical protein
MRRLMKYRDIVHTMQYLMKQSELSLPFMRGFIPLNEIHTPEEFFNFMKSKTTFIEDPPETELLQTAQTLFTNNFHGVPGGGDCDCLCIAAIAGLYWLNVPVYVMLAGRQTINPVHIYLKVLDKGKLKSFDLTEQFYNSEREYPYKQRLQVNFSEKNKKKFKNNLH